MNCENCGKEAKSNAGLAAHKRKCLKTAPPDTKQEAKTLTKEEEQRIIDDVKGKNIPTVEETIALTTRKDGIATTKSGIVIPPQVLVKMTSTKFKYVLRCSSSTAEVWKVAPSGRDLHVRTYEKHIHGEGFREMAEQFCQKNNA